ncbi:DsbA family oxidoreductase [Aeromicrobium endophyticum]|uniref:DsbA family oxidoreductase n=1 Tax=Aeromicrobium endophyticum TaxID=2292704 RepID=UPI001314AA15|nr:DsbA family protein [Aeromicrobium endophyticum]
MKVIVFADVTDPWAYIGATRFERAAAMFSILTGEPVEMTFRAFQVPVDDSDDARARVVAAAKITGIDLDFDDVLAADSFDAWRLLTWADEAGPGFQRDLAHQLWRAHFLEGADIADPFTLATRAALVGLELETAEALLASTEYADEVRTQNETGQSLAIDALPYVVVDQRWTLEGMQSQNDYVQALSQMYSEQQGDSSSDA